MADAPARFKDLCLDARDHQAVADWWCAALGYVRRPSAEPRDPAWPVPIEDPAGAGPLIWVNPVTEPKTVKNRMHLDVVGNSSALQAAARRCCAPGTPRSAGTCSPTRRATSSAASRRSETAAMISSAEPGLRR
jgi:hypothetical protein